MRRFSRWVDWLMMVAPSIWLAWFLLKPELKTFVELWHVARGITTEMFVQATVVVVVIVAVVYFAAKRYPALDGNAHPFIGRMATRAAPHVSYVFHWAWPPIGRFFSAIGRGLWRILSAVGRGLAWFFTSLWHLLMRMVPEAWKRWIRRLGESSSGGSRPMRSKRAYVRHDYDERDDRRRNSAERFINRFVEGNWWIYAFYVGGFLKLNGLNDPAHPFWMQATLFGLLLLVVLTLGWSYRTVLAIIMLECYLAWVSAVDGVKVGTVYMLLFGVTYLLWLGFRKFILNAKPQPGAAPGRQEG